MLSWTLITSRTLYNFHCEASVERKTGQRINLIKRHNKVFFGHYENFQQKIFSEKCLKVLKETSFNK